jgi:hypothetical protein
VVRGGRRIRKDTKTHQDRYLAIDPVTCDVLREHKRLIEAAIAAVGLKLAPSAYVFSNDPAGAAAWNPDWATHKVAEVTAAAGSASTSRGCAITPRPSSFPAASTCATPLPASATAAAAPPSGTTLTRFPKSTAAPPPTSPTSPAAPAAHPQPRMRDGCPGRFATSGPGC